METAYGYFRFATHGDIASASRDTEIQFQALLHSTPDFTRSTDDPLRKSNLSTETREKLLKYRTKWVHRE